MWSISIKGVITISKKKYLPQRNAPTARSFHQQHFTFYFLT
jgi:hypothetical protein